MMLEIEAGDLGEVAGIQNHDRRLIFLPVVNHHHNPAVILLTDHLGVATALGPLAWDKGGFIDVTIGTR